MAREDVPSAYGCNRGTRSSSLYRQGPSAVERAAILPEVVAPRERWAKLAKWTTAELDGRRSPIGRHPSERPHATPPGSPRSWPGCPAAPTRSSSLRRLHRPESTPGNAAGAPPSPLMTEVHSIRHERAILRAAGGFLGEGRFPPSPAVTGPGSHRSVGLPARHLAASPNTDNLGWAEDPDGGTDGQGGCGPVAMGAAFDVVVAHPAADDAGVGA